MGFATDVIVRKFTIAPDAKIKAAIIFIKGLVRKELINKNVVRGPKDGFTENIDNDTVLIRRGIKSTELLGCI